MVVASSLIAKAKGCNPFLSGQKAAHATGSHADLATCIAPQHEFSPALWLV
jgi:hypothetical protein